MLRPRFMTVAIVSFSVGLLIAGPVRQWVQIFRGEVNKNCVSDTICVGADLKTVHGFGAQNSIGGLASIFCGIPGDTDNIEYLFLRDILAGATCSRDQFTLHFQDDFTRTSISVRGGKITELAEGPVQPFDP